ncbi:transcriptional regulator [Desulfurococcaceae archaeon MEX13E-LK6-19]|nr:transcriptional regulator [Desulfurococcaceae archaeon MEX13E-LK6-19]
MSHSDETVSELVKTLAKNKVFGAPVRLAVMIYLLAREEAYFSDLVQVLDLTPGNLWSHLKKLESEGYIVLKRVIADRPRVKIALTQKGYEKIMEIILMIKKIKK